MAFPRYFWLLTVALVAAGLLMAVAWVPAGPAERPNVVIIFLDDAGWADFSPFDRSVTYTPNAQELAAAGVTFSNFYVPQGVCSASRAALLTGCYPGRTGVHGAFPPRRAGLDRKFATMAEVFSAGGYRTAIFGKWHLGDTDGTRPWDRGFDESAGLLYSADMWKNHPEDPEYWGRFPLQFFENGEVLIDDVGDAEQRTLTRRYTDYATDFIRRNRETPFFLYVPHNQPHVPLFVGEEFAGKTGMGLYADVIGELDWSIGQIKEELATQGLLENTIFIVSSDNGPWLSYGNHAGVTPFREGKTTSWDGGVKTGMLFSYPELTAGGRHLDNVVFSIDLLPTLCDLTGVALPAADIDGKSFTSLLTGENGFLNKQPYYAVSNLGELQAIISSDGRFKLHAAHDYKTMATAGKDGMPGTYRRDSIGPVLYDLRADPFERFDVKNNHPKVYQELLQRYQTHLAKFYKN